LAILPTGINHNHLTVLREEREQFRKCIISLLLN